MPIKKGILKDLKKDIYLYLMLLPIVAFYLLFRYGPMYGLVIAFKDFNIMSGIMGSKWVGFEHFRKLFTSDGFYLILRNTLLLNVYSILLSFPLPIFLAILLNEIRSIYYRRIIQSLLYVPHFISWVVLGGIFMTMLSPSTGIVNILLKNLGFEPIYFMSSPFWWPLMYVISGIWQGTGWGTIIYLAAISGIDVQLYEAAQLDGASKFQQMWHITLPCLKSTIAILFILRLGHMMDVGFEHIYILQNDAVMNVSDVISTYVYRLGIQGAQYSYTTALGFFQSVINLIMIASANKLVKKFGEDGLW